MNSTERRQRKALASFFRRRLLPLANDPRLMRYADKEVGGPPSVGAEDRDTYFVPKSRAPMSRADFELNLADEAEIKATLEAYWRGSPLDGVAGPLVKLSLLFRGIDEREELSSSVYEMF